MKPGSRESDEQILEMLALSDEGLTHGQIAEQIGVKRERVSVAMRRVRTEFEASL